MRPLSTAGIVPAAILPIALGLAATALASDGEQAVKPIDVVTIIGRQTDANDVPGSAHIVDSEVLATFSQSDILRVLQSVPGVYVQEEEGFGLAATTAARLERRQGHADAVTQGRWRRSNRAAVVAARPKKTHIT